MAWIKLHRYGKEVWANTNNIADVYEFHGRSVCIDFIGGDNCIDVDESVGEVLDLIKKAEGE